MSKEENTKELSFRDFLDKSTNLLTIFGVLNALIIYSDSIVKTQIKEFIIIPLFVLSFFVLYELFVFSAITSKEEMKFTIFSFCIASIEIGMVLLFLDSFKWVLFLATFFSISYFITKSLSKYRYNKNLSTIRKINTAFPFFIIAISLVIAGLANRFIIIPFVEFILKGM